MCFGYQFDTFWLFFFSLAVLIFFPHGCDKSTDRKQHWGKSFYLTWFQALDYNFREVKAGTRADCHSTPQSGAKNLNKCIHVCLSHPTLSSLFLFRTFRLGNGDIHKRTIGWVFKHQFSIKTMSHILVHKTAWSRWLFIKSLSSKDKNKTQINPIWIC